MTRHLAIAIAALTALPLACSKVPIYNVEAAFVTADAAWFEEEQTLFFFAEVRAQQGLGDDSVIEVRFTTDDGRLAWTDIDALPKVHTHVPVDCGRLRRCSSTSVHVPSEPRDVEIRLRYHREGDLSLLASTAYNVVRAGPPHSSRSMVVYGVFDERNENVQWRGRHQFPTIRNERASELGLRRDVVVEEPHHGLGDPSSADNPYGYGVGCPDDWVDTQLPPLAFDERAAFHPDPLPVDAWDDEALCAQATVFDATGAFTTTAFARKNPEVKPAFPLLRSPVEDATPLKFFLGPCRRTIDADHEEMQRQRLQLEDVPTTCIDDFDQPGFDDELVVLFRNAIEQARPDGDDMVLVIALHRDDEGMVEVVEEALTRVVPRERDRASPRLAGAFLFDSRVRGMDRLELAQTTLWCPAELPLDELPNASARSCPVLPDIPELELGPLSFTVMPILPSRVEYSNFLETYGKSQAGQVTDLAYRTPEFATTSDTVDLGEFGAVTFLNGEQIDTEPAHAFSYCVGENTPVVVFRSEFVQSEAFQKLVRDDCASLGLPEEVCAVAAAGVLPLELLPEWHEALGEDEYGLGLFWEFPFLLRMEYEAVTAGAATALGFSVPFGIRTPAEAYYGTEQWTAEEHVLEDALTECTRYCEHPTFDSAGVYHVTDPFVPTYLTTCYLPDYPAPGDGGFPRDP